MSEISIERIIRFIQKLIHPPFFLTTRRGRNYEVHLEVRYLDVSERMKSSLLHETIHLLHMHTSEEVRERLHEELLAVAVYTQKHSTLLFAFSLINEPPVRIKLIQNEQVTCQTLIRTQDDLKAFVQSLDTRWMRQD